MNDRVPGAPGQRRMTITPEEFAKLQQGQSAVVTLVRDDKPITPGTPYSKEAVLPDELAQKICPEIADPAPADALKHLLPTNGAFPMTGGLDMGGNRITNLADPQNEKDAIPLSYFKSRVRFGGYNQKFESDGSTIIRHNFGFKSAAHYSLLFQPMYGNLIAVRTENLDGNSTKVWLAAFNYVTGSIGYYTDGGTQTIRVIAIGDEW